LFAGKREQSGHTPTSGHGPERSGGGGGARSIGRGGLREGRGERWNEGPAGRHLGHLVTAGSGILAREGPATPTTTGRLEIHESVDPIHRDEGAAVALVAGRAPRACAPRGEPPASERRGRDPWREDGRSSASSGEAEPPGPRRAPGARRSGHAAQRPHAPPAKAPQAGRRPRPG
jgi:hypothetical protein